MKPDPTTTNNLPEATTETTTQEEAATEITKAETMVISKETTTKEVKITTATDKDNTLNNISKRKLITLMKKKVRSQMRSNLMKIRRDLFSRSNTTANRTFQF